jgi:hypothetical protein
MAVFDGVIDVDVVLLIARRFVSGFRLKKDKTFPDPIVEVVLIPVHQIQEHLLTDGVSVVLMIALRMQGASLLVRERCCSDRRRRKDRTAEQ